MTHSEVDLVIKHCLLLQCEPATVVEEEFDDVLWDSMEGTIKRDISVAT
jgi:hypothetical protein